MSRAISNTVHGAPASARRCKVLRGRSAADQLRAWPRRLARHRAPAQGTPRSRQQPGYPRVSRRENPLIHPPAQTPPSPRAQASAPPGAAAHNGSPAAPRAPARWPPQRRPPWAAGRADARDGGQGAPDRHRAAASRGGDRPLARAAPRRSTAAGRRRRGTMVRAKSITRFSSTCSTKPEGLPRPE